MVGVNKLCKNEKEWNDFGFTITGRDEKTGDGKLTETSYTIKTPHYTIITPFYKELSWLFRNTCRDYQKMSFETYEQSFWSACTCFFLTHKTFKPKTLLFYVIDFLSAVNDSITESV